MPTGKSFGEERLLASVVSNRERPAADVLEGILSEIRSFTTHAAPTQRRDGVGLALSARLKPIGSLCAES